MGDIMAPSAAIMTLAAKIDAAAVAALTETPAMKETDGETGAVTVGDIMIITEGRTLIIRRLNLRTNPLTSLRISPHINPLIRHLTLSRRSLRPTIRRRAVLNPALFSTPSCVGPVGSGCV